ncbi:MAG TPA: multicopper oxidase domain-containing protein [Thermoanaerobaculia bacterium]
MSFPFLRTRLIAVSLAAFAISAVAPLAGQKPVILDQTPDGPCEILPQLPKAGAKLTARAQAPRGDLFTSVELAETPAHRLAILKKTALYAAPAETWIDPPEISGDTSIDTTLRIAYATNTVNGKAVNLRSYIDPRTGKGSIPSPTFRLKKDGVERRLRVLVQNDLPCNGGKPGDPTCRPAKCDFHEHQHGGDPNDPKNFRLNDTNLHVHGLHVSPRPPQDDVLLTVEPGCKYQVDVRIPKDHLPGTAWYHPHQHGSTALQLASGMAGALILEGDIDRVPEIRAAAEKIFVFQQISFDSQTGLNEDFKKLDKQWNANKITLVNGQAKPEIAMKKGEVQRWRFINAGFFEVLPLRLTADDASAGEPDLHAIAVDGISLPRREARQRIDLAPGNRADALVKFDRPGRYYLYKSESMRQRGVLEKAQILAQIDVSDEAKEMKLPDLLPGDAIKPIDQRAAKPRAPLFFSVRFDEQLKRPRFIINGRDFVPNRVDQTLKLGATEEWTVYNCTDQDHPYHIHVNPFQVTEYSAPDGSVVRIDDPKKRPWHDTFAIPKGRPAKDKDNKPIIIPGYFKMLTHYEDFDGRFVLHCHILSHEDQGMMQLIDIVK